MKDVFFVNNAGQYSGVGVNSQLFINAVKEIVNVRVVNIKLHKKIDLIPGEIRDRSYTSYININRALASLKRVTVDQSYTTVYSDATSIFYAKPLKGIVFFHHANLFTNPKGYPFSQKFALRIILKKLEKVDRIVTLSNFTKKTLQVHTKLNNIKVIPPYVSMPLPDAELVKKYRNIFKPPIVLAVGTSIKMKNFITLYNALSGTELTIVRVGGKKTSEVPSNVKFLGEGNLSPIEMSSIYAAADLLAFTSFDEGFGRPLIEAMSLGLPIVANRCTSVPEIVGEAGLLVKNPFDSNELRESIFKALDDKTELSKKSYERARLFSKKRYIKDMENLLDDLE